MDDAKIIKPIVLTDTDTGEKYELEFNLDSVKFTNRQGFKVSELTDNPEEMLPILFYGAFRMHHKNVSRQQTDDMLINKLKGLSDAVAARLLELYAAPRNTLVRADDDGEGGAKNATMVAEI